MNTVSVIIPNYNHASYLKQRIDSVLNQTYPDFEVIILDDCSTDNSRDVIDCYRKHPKIRSIIYNEQNSGSTFRQWLKGISEAQGAFIWIAESDDWCEPTLLENLVPFVAAKPDCVVGYCQAYCVSENEIKAQSSHPYLSEYVDGKSFIKNYMISTNSIYNASMAVWRKDAFQKITQDFVNYKLGGDWLFWIELATTGNVFISGRLLNYFRKHDRDVSEKAYSSGYNFVEELRLFNNVFDKGLIALPLYKKELNRKYLRYSIYKTKISDALQQEINKEFVKNVSPGYLFRNYLVTSSKYKGYKFIKKFIEKNK